MFTVVALLAAAAVMVTRLRPDPLLLARSVGAHDEDEPAEVGGHDRPWAVIRHTPLVLAAVVGMALSHAVMVSVMVMTPIHMDHGGASLEIIGLVISGHVLGMFAFSPLVGMLTDRIGSPLGRGDRWAGPPVVPGAERPVRAGRERRARNRALPPRAGLVVRDGGARPRCSSPRRRSATGRGSRGRPT